MRAFNLSTRIVMFSICSSIEYDLKKHILNSQTVINFTNSMIEKAKFRVSKIDTNECEDVLDQLDLSDYISIISTNPHDYQMNNETARELLRYFEKIIPVRNRVMHTKPLELGDRAILFEVLENINKDIKWIDWKETSLTKEILINDPSKLITKNYSKVLEYNPSMFHNLPEPEFDDTGYIGRKKEIKDIKELINNNKNQIITIVGNGGIGKTAIAVKSLYELIDDNAKFDAIIWISLKTKTLSRGEFIAIRDAISTIPDMYFEGARNSIYDNRLDPKENLLTFMQVFNVLLVIDNLETINNQEISQFLKEIPGNSKVLVTSRHGIGELEYRYVLDGMNSTDAIIYYRELSKYYGLELYKKSDQELKDLINGVLYSNPLSIKWFISGIYNGLDENALISNKSKLIEFCMSNVFNKLAENSRKILLLFLIENKELTLGEIDYLISLDDVELRKSINELLTTNMIKLISSKYMLNDMARDYLSIYHAPDNSYIVETLRKRKELNRMLQEIRVRTENDPFNPTSIFANFDDDNRKLASYYLTKALEASSYHKWEIAFGFLEKAANIAPDYFEVYKIRAFISAEKNELFDAISNYKIALSKCDSELERAVILCLFATFYVIKLSEYEIALTKIEEAERQLPAQINILLEKSRILMYLGKYSAAEEVLMLVDSQREKLDSKMENIYACRYADLFRRKAENFDLRDVDKKLCFLKKGVHEIEKLKQIDTKTYLVLIRFLKDLSFLYFDKNAMEFLCEVLTRHFSELESIRHRDYKRMKDVLIAHKEEIPINLYEILEKYIIDPRLAAKHIYDTNKGVIVFIKGHYGFIANASNGSIYFNINNLLEPAQYGDMVEFELYENHKGKAANKIRKI